MRNLKSVCIVDNKNGEIRHIDLRPDEVELIFTGLAMLNGSEESTAHQIESHLERERCDKNLPPRATAPQNEFSRAARAKAHRCQALMEQLRMPNPVNHQPDVRQVLVDQIMEEQRAEELGAGW